MFSFRLENFNPAPRINNGFSMAQVVIDTQVIKDSNYYAPEDQEFLQRSALLLSNIGSGKILWQTPYSRRLYYNPQFNFATDKNPNARGLWFEAAKADKKSNWVAMGQAAMNAGMGG